jgi:hypothetical protein
MDTTFDDTFLYDFSQVIDPADYSSLPQLDFDQDTLQCLLETPQEFAAAPLAPATSQPPTYHGLSTPESSIQLSPAVDQPTEDIKQ